MLNVQDLEEVVHLREKQAEMERKVDEADARLAVALGEVASLWQLVEAMRCHAPNRFGTVNMEDNVYIKRS